MSTAFKLLQEATFAAAVDPVTGKIDMQSLTTGVSVRDRANMQVAEEELEIFLREDPLKMNEAFEKVNTALGEKKLRPLNWGKFRSVVENLKREERILQRDDQLSVP